MQSAKSLKFFFKGCTCGEKKCISFPRREKMPEKKPEKASQSEIRWSKALTNQLRDVSISWTRGLRFWILLKTFLNIPDSDFGVEEKIVPQRQEQALGTNSSSDNEIILYFSLFPSHTECTNFH